ncbi:FAD-dependent monooxygenase [Oecophyllibacter saccharovorans]|uniref:Ubiquinone biosynthesis protein UbiH n=1 Tax=Oecophyllibacter saccharovorans TaxID=2558360 RepID=A0A506URK9_9PROT|nr:FAD-dependent monooxygenase [Oecophyllibacter saccharovorans]TPW35986.1 ubiquinone biosynthesis protein UbiH [Oecophyllibacter saccharovorans]
MSKHYDLCINGGGPIGSTLACLVARQGRRVLLLERNPFVTEPLSSLDGRAYALAEGVIPLLEQAGIWAQLPRPAEAIRAIHVLDGQGPLPRASRRQIASDGLTFQPEDAPAQRPFGWMVEAYDLLAAIARTVSSHPELDVRAPETGSFDFREDRVDITLSSGEKASASLVVAADGRRSALRQQAGIGVQVTPFHKHALVAAMAHEKPHHGSALENFLPQGPFARLPLPASDRHPHRSAIVWTDTPQRIKHFHDMPAEAFARLVEERLGGEALGKVTLAGQRWLYPLASQYALRYTAPRLALIGDAAHGLHPVAGQGMNLGFRDVRTLAALLEEAWNEGSGTARVDLGAPALLARYQHSTRPGNFAMLLACNGMEHLFSTHNPFLRGARQLGLKALERLPGLRRSFVQQAMGL